MLSKQNDTEKALNNCDWFYNAHGPLHGIHFLFLRQFLTGNFQTISTNCVFRFWSSC